VLAKLFVCSETDASDVSIWPLMPHPRAYLQVLTLASRQPAVLRTAATPAAVAAQVGLQAMLVYCVRAATRT